MCPTPLPHQSAKCNQWAIRLVRYNGFLFLSSPARHRVLHWDVYTDKLLSTCIHHHHENKYLYKYLYPLDAWDRVRPILIQIKYIYILYTHSGVTYMWPLYPPRECVIVALLYYIPWKQRLFILISIISLYVLLIKHVQIFLGGPWPNNLVLAASYIS